MLRLDKSCFFTQTKIPQATGVYFSYGATASLNPLHISLSLNKYYPQVCIVHLGFSFVSWQQFTTVGLFSYVTSLLHFSQVFFYCSSALLKHFPIFYLKNLTQLFFLIKNSILCCQKEKGNFKCNAVETGLIYHLEAKGLPRISKITINILCFLKQKNSFAF